ncbi:hypothetical protein [Burkholderia sp. S171]|uniref:hypothetical protein n=1 Tax=Burkholderia sp. S171 TaxID=1641860 RepID=UPI00131C6CE5|nr:hypothetical protein [Burkholderia sp. S171]
MSLGDIQGDVHQAVDVAFSIADLIGSLFSTVRDPNRKGMPHHFLLGGTVGGPQVVLAFTGAAGEPPSLQCSGNAAAVVTVTSPVPLLSGQDAVSNGPLPLYSQAIYVPQNSSVPLTNFNKMTKGVFTASLVPVADPGYPVILMGLNGRNFLSHESQLTSDLSVTVNSAGITLASQCGAPYQMTANVTSAAPIRSQTHIAAIPQGEFSTTVPFDPIDFAASAIASVSYVLSGPFSMLPAAPANARRIAAG